MVCTRMKRAVIFILACLLLVTGVPVGNCTVGTQKVLAAMTKLFHFDEHSGKKLSKTVKVDLTGDATKEEVSFYATENRYSTVDTLSIDINGENALTLNALGYAVTISYIQLSAKEKFLYIVDSYDNGDPTVDAIYRYNENTKKLNKVLSLDTVKWKKGAYHVYSTVKTSKSTLKVTYNGQMNATWYIDWVFDYKFKNGKFVLKNNTAKVIRKYHKGNFVADKTITFYKKAGTYKKAFTINRGTAVKLQKIKLIKNTYYLQFKYGKKTGWIRAGKSNIFKGVVLTG